jgi:thiol reductant ABC exporter CydC subunit
MAVLRRLVVLSSPPWRQLGAATAYGVAAAGATVGLLAGSGYVVDRAAFRPGLGAIAGVLAVVEVLAFVRAPLRYGERLAAHDAALRALVRWRVWLFDRLEPLSPAGLRSWRSGDLLTRAMQDVDTLQDLYVRGLAPVIAATTSSVLAVVVVAVLVPPAGLILGACLGVALTVPPAIALAGAAADEHEAALRGALGGDVVDLLQGAAELVAFDRDTEVLARVGDADRRLRRMGRRRGLRSAFSAAVISLSGGSAAVGVLIVAVDALRHHRLNNAMVAVLPLTAIAAFELVPAVTAAAQRAGALVAAGRRLLALEEVAPPVVDPDRPEPVPPGVPRIELVDAHLRYRDDLPSALNGLSMTLHPGQRLALTGPSGSGKSSVVNVLLRFWELSAGEATLGGVPVGHLAQADVRRTISLVEQDARLFSGTVRHNVTLARPDAGDDEIERAIRLAHLGDWIDALPLGLETPVGEQGAQVSGGQRQRIALARALLADARVLLLDEPTGGLDEATARALLADVLQAGGRASVLLITHHEDEAAAVADRVHIDAGCVTGAPATAAGTPAGRAQSPTRAMLSDG